MRCLESLRKRTRYIHFLNSAVLQARSRPRGGAVRPLLGLRMWAATIALAHRPHLCVLGRVRRWLPHYSTETTSGKHRV